MPSPRRVASPSMWYKAVGCTTERADHGTPGMPDILAMSWVGSRESGQNRQKGSGRGGLSGKSSPVITQERVIGSLRSSMHKENISPELRQLCSALECFAPRGGA